MHQRLQGSSMSRLRKKYLALGKCCHSKFLPLITEWQERKDHFSDLGKTGDQSKQRILLSCPLRPTQPGALTGFSQTHHFITRAQLVEIWIWGLFLICARYNSHQWKPQDLQVLNNWASSNLIPLTCECLVVLIKKEYQQQKNHPRRKAQSRKSSACGVLPPPIKVVC